MAQIANPWNRARPKGSSDAGTEPVSTDSATRRPSSGPSVTPLHIAAGHGKNDALRVLLAHGAKTDVVDDSGRTPLMLAKRPAKSPRKQQARDEAIALLEAHAEGR